jgi:hypothetical protein
MVRTMMTMTRRFRNASQAARLAMFAGIVLAAGLATSCGGGGGTSSPSGGGGTPSAAARVDIYVTSSSSNSWSQVVVTLYQIEVSTNKGATYQSVFDNPSGQSLDVASLNQAVQLLSSATLPAGAITNARVTLGSTFTLTPKGGALPTTVPVDGSLPNVAVSNGQATFTFGAATPLAGGKLSNLVIDFKLAAFELVSGQIQPAIGLGNAGAVPSEQNVANLSGAVSNYVAGSGFDLTPNCGQGSTTTNVATPAVIHVAITSATAIIQGPQAPYSPPPCDPNNPGPGCPGTPPPPPGGGYPTPTPSGGNTPPTPPGGGYATPTPSGGNTPPSPPGGNTPPSPPGGGYATPTPPGGNTPPPPPGGGYATPGPTPSATPATLANGDDVIVTGTTDPTTGTVTATLVEIVPASGAGGGSGSTTPQPVSEVGQVDSLGSDGTSFVLTIRGGVALTADYVIALNVETNSSTAFEDGGAPATFSQVTVGSYVAVAGVMDPSSGIVTAQSVVILPAPPPGGNWPGPVPD